MKRWDTDGKIIKQSPIHGFCRQCRTHVIVGALDDNRLCESCQIQDQSLL